MTATHLSSAESKLMELKTIAHIHTDFPAKFGLPRQSGIVSGLTGVIEFEEEFRDPSALIGLDGYSHIWLIWGFSEKFASRSDDDQGWNPTVRPPRLGGNKRVGVFATRSPNRPNPLAMSVVKLEKIECGKIYVSGIDMMDMTPIYDIKPYLPSIDAHPEAKGGFAKQVEGDLLSVELPTELADKLPPNKIEPLIECLKGDVRPSYRQDSREYGFPYAGFEIKFRVYGDRLTVTDIVKL